MHKSKPILTHTQCISEADFLLHSSNGIYFEKRKSKRKLKKKHQFVVCFFVDLRVKYLAYQTEKVFTLHD